MSKKKHCLTCRYFNCKHPDNFNFGYCNHMAFTLDRMEPKFPKCFHPRKIDISCDEWKPRGGETGGV